MFFSVARPADFLLVYGLLGDSNSSLTRNIDGFVPEMAMQVLANHQPSRSTKINFPCRCSAAKEVRVQGFCKSWGDLYHPTKGHQPEPNPPLSAKLSAKLPLPTETLAFRQFRSPFPRLIHSAAPAARWIPLLDPDSFPRGGLPAVLLFPLLHPFCGQPPTALPFFLAANGLPCLTRDYRTGWVPRG